MNILSAQINVDQKYQQMASLFKGQVQNNCSPTDLYNAYHQILTDLYKFQEFIQKADQYYLFDRVRNQIKKYENLRKEIQWTKVYSIQYGRMYDNIYRFWRQIKITVKREEQDQRERRRMKQIKEEQEQVQRLQEAMNRLAVSNWKCYNGHKCVLQSGKEANRCNICRQKIQKKLLLRCSACDFDICQNCADNQDPSIVHKFYPTAINSTKTNTNTNINSIKPSTQKIQAVQSNNLWVCAKNHQLRQTTDKSENECNICWQEIGLRPQQRCQQCDFDVCNNCWTTKNPKIVKMYDNYFEPQRCEKGHKMRPIHTTLAHFCDICNKRLISEPFITCIQCNYDVCQSCNKEQEQQQSDDSQEQNQESFKPIYNQSQRNKSKPKLCQQGHQAIFYPNGGAYSSGKFICSHCQKVKGKVKTYHCPLCQWDICDECIIRLNYA